MDECVKPPRLRYDLEMKELLKGLRDNCLRIQREAFKSRNRYSFFPFSD